MPSAQLARLLAQYNQRSDDEFFADGGDEGMDGA
jgi:hypothetical protein